MESHKIALLAGVSMLVGGTAAEAAVITLPSQNFSLDAFSTSTIGNDSEQLDFAQFDANLGTLTKVTLSLDLSTLIGEGSTGGSNFPENSTTFRLDVDVTASFTAPNAGDSFPVLELTAQCTANDGNGNSCAGSNEASSNPLFFTELTAGDVLAYVGAGTVAVNFSLQALGVQSQTGSPGEFNESSIDGDWNGRFTVTYTYDPRVEEPGGDVPEPATLGLVGLGALALGAAARRRAREMT